VSVVIRASAARGRIARPNVARSTGPSANRTTTASPHAGGLEVRARVGGEDALEAAHGTRRPVAQQPRAAATRRTPRIHPIGLTTARAPARRRTRARFDRELRTPCAAAEAYLAAAELVGRAEHVRSTDNDVRATSTPVVADPRQVGFERRAAREQDPHDVEHVLLGNGRRARRAPPCGAARLELVQLRQQQRREARDAHRRPAQVRGSSAATVRGVVEQRHDHRRHVRRVAVRAGRARPARPATVRRAPSRPRGPASGARRTGGAGPRDRPSGRARP
jgi:hypothetical protein